MASFKQITYADIDKITYADIDRLKEFFINNRFTQYISEVITSLTNAGRESEISAYEQKVHALVELEGRVWNMLHKRVIDDKKGLEVAEIISLSTEPDMKKLIETLFRLHAETHNLDNVVPSDEDRYVFICDLLLMENPDYRHLTEVQRRNLTPEKLIKYVDKLLKTDPHNNPLIYENPMFQWKGKAMLADPRSRAFYDERSHVQYGPVFDAKKGPSYVKSTPYKNLLAVKEWYTEENPMPAGLLGRLRNPTDHASVKQLAGQAKVAEEKAKAAASSAVAAAGSGRGSPRAGGVSVARERAAAAAGAAAVAVSAAAKAVVANPQPTAAVKQTVHSAVKATGAAAKAAAAVGTGAGGQTAKKAALDAQQSAQQLEALVLPTGRGRRVVLNPAAVQAQQAALASASAAASAIPAEEMAKLKQRAQEMRDAAGQKRERSPIEEGEIEEGEDDMVGSRSSSRSRSRSRSSSPGTKTGTKKAKHGGRRKRTTKRNKLFAWW